MSRSAGKRFTLSKKTTSARTCTGKPWPSARIHTPGLRHPDKTGNISAIVIKNLVMADNSSQSLIGQILDPVGLISYQDGAVVSRTIVVRKSGTVTLFAFDKGEGLSEHTAPFDAMVQVLEGSVEITISGTPFILEKGAMIIMPAGKPHALKAISKFKMMLTMIHE